LNFNVSKTSKRKKGDRRKVKVNRPHQLVLVVRLPAELISRLQTSEQVLTSARVPAAEVVPASEPANEMGLAPSWELHWSSILEDEQIFWQILVYLATCLINALTLVMTLWYEHDEDVRKQKLMDEKINRLYNQTLSIVKEMKAMKAEREENAQNH
jgi:hypothetical protein